MTVRSSIVIDLNVLSLRLTSNLADFGGRSFFTRLREDASAPADYEVVCVDLDRDPVDVALLESMADRTYRAERFRGGYYLAHHFGDPAYLVARGRTFYVFGRHLEKTVWPYFVKHILTVHGADRDMLHLKAAAFAAPGGGATLLAGRGSGGKTVLLTQACRAGADFVSNTHVMLAGTTVYGVPSAMRVRRDRCFEELIAGGALAPHLDSGEYRVTPESLFGGRTRDSAEVRNLCIVDFRDGQQRFEKIGDDLCYDILEQFALPVPTYGLKDDLLAHHEGDMLRSAAVYRRMKVQLAELVQRVRCFYVSIDMFDPGSRNEVLSGLEVI